MGGGKEREEEERKKKIREGERGWQEEITEREDKGKGKERKEERNE